MLNSRSGFLRSILALLLPALALNARAQTAHFSYAQLSLGGGFAGITSVALDRNGNAFVTDTSAGAVEEIAPGCISAACVRTLATGFVQPNGVAVDASGNVFVAELGSVVGPGAPASEDGGIFEIVAVNGSIPSASPTVRQLGGATFNGPAGIAVDANGNLFVADTYNSAVREILAAGAYATINTLGSGFNHPFGVAVDAGGNVFVADTGNSAIKEILAVNGSIPASPAINTLASSLSSPSGVAVDPAGNVYFADLGLSSDSTLYEILAVNGSIPASSPAIAKIFTGIYSNFALDAAGDIYLNPGAVATLLELETQAVNLGSATLGQTAAAVPLTFTFDTAGTIGSPAALTLGSTGLDYAVAAGGTCSAGTAFAAGSTCTLNLAFAPRYPGARNGAAVLKNASGNIIATAYLHGFGVGPQLGFPPGPFGIQSLPYIGIEAQRGIAVDAAGNVFVANENPNTTITAISEVPPGCTNATCVKNLAGSFYAPWGLAVDGGGNLFAGDIGSPGQFSEILAAGGYTTVKTITGTFGAPYGVAVDGSANIFFSESGGTAVKELLAAGGYKTVRTLATGFYSPSGVAVDASGNVFVDDYGNHVVKEIVAVNGVIPAAPAVNTLGAGFTFTYPTAIAVDANSNVFVTDSVANQQAVYEIQAAGGYTTVTTVSKGFDAPAGMAIDQAGNLHIVDGTYLDLLDRSDPPAIDFQTPTPPGIADTIDNPQTVTVQNIGNASLNLATLAVTGSSFKLDSAATTCANTSTLAIGAVCTAGIDFTPAATGPLTGTLTFTDNSLNAAAATQPLALSGTGLLAATVAVAPSPSSLTTAQPLAVTVTVSGSSGTPTGLVALTGGGYVSANNTLVNGVATIAIPPGSLSVGTDTLSVAYTPDASSASTYYGGNGSAPVTVTAAILATPTVTVTPTPAAITTGQTLSVAVAVTGSAATPTGSVTLTSGSYASAPATLTAGSAAISVPAGSLPSGVDAITAAYTPDSASATTYNAATGSNSVTVNAGAAPAGPAAFGTVAIGQTSAPVSITFTFAAAITLGAPVALTQGAPNLDFAIAGGTCVSGASFTAGNSCTLSVTFKPRFSGLRTGAVRLNDSSGNAIAQDYLSGSGSGPQVSFLPSTRTALGGGFTLSVSVAVDGSGNVFVADYSDQIKEVPAGCTTAACVKVLASGFNQAAGVALDGAGNVFVADTYNNAVKEILAAGGYTTVKTLATGLSFPAALAVDTSGNVFVADEGDPTITDHSLDQVKEILAAGGYTTVNTLGSGFIYPDGIAVDASGNVFVADTGNNAVRELLAAGGYTTSTTIGSGFHTPGGIALDANANLYVADTNNSALKEVPAAGGYANTITLATYAEFSPNGVAVDAAGNIYTAGPDADEGVYKLDYADPPALAFAATTSVGTTDTLDGIQTVTLQNIGNAALTVTALAPPAANFSTAAGTTCSASSTIAAGAACALAVQFAPAAPGKLTGAFTFTDNALNAAGSTQQITFSGVAETDSAPPAPAITAEPPNPTGVTTATFSFTDTEAGVTFVCSLDGAAFTACSSGVSYPALTNGAHAFAVKAADPLGNLSAPAAYSFTTTAVPTPIITSAPASQTTATGAAFTFTDAQAGVAFACSLDSAPFAACSSGILYSSLAAGPHTFAVEARDAAGNASNTAAAAWTIASAVNVRAGIAIDFGTSPIGTPTAPMLLTFTLAAPATLGSPVALTQAAPGLDFAIAGGGTCAAGVAIAANGTCTLSLTFTPTYPGVRNGAVLLKDASGNLLATAYVRGTGSGPEATFMDANLSPSSTTSLGGGFTSPEGIAVDGAGNVYVADMGNSAIKKIPAGCLTATCVQTLGGNFWSPRGVAVDAAGNAFVADWGNAAVKEIPAGCLAASCVQVLATRTNGISSPYGIAVDSSGNVFFADLGNNMIYEIVAASGYSTITPLGGTFPFAQPESVAVDGSGNVFVVQTGITPTTGCNGIVCVQAGVALLEIPAATGYATVNTLQTGLNAPIFVSVDGVGNVFIAEFVSQSGAVQEFLAAENYYAKDWQLDLHCSTTGYCNRTGVAVDGAGNIYLADDDTGVNSITKLDFADPPQSFAFPTPTTAGSIDLTDNTNAVYILNNGNAALTLNAITTSASFFDDGSTVAPCAVSTPIAPDAYCATYAFFSPVASGTVTGTLALTDNNLNAVGATQQIALTGTGLVAAPVITGAPPTSTTATTATFTFTNVESSVTFLCSLDGAAYSACSSGIAYSSLTLAAHTFSVEAKDTAGTVGPAAGYSWTVTAAAVAPPPPPVITSGPPYLDTSTSATFTFTDTEAGATFLCTLNSGAFTPCPTPYTYTALANGDYTLLVFAEDSAGNIDFTAAEYNFAVETTPPTLPSTAGVFGNVPTGTASAPLTLTATFAAGGTLGSIAALTLGAPNLDFALAAPGTCAAGTTYAAGNTCTLSATFTPRAPGARSGALVLYDTSSPAKVLATVYVSGTGVGPAISFGPGIINTVVGGGTGCAAQTDSLGDGCPATSAILTFGLGATAVDGAGNLYVADEADDRVRKVSAATGIITSIAGIGTKGNTGDGGPATSAQLGDPIGIALDGAGNIFLADAYANTIRRIDAATGIISTVAGTGTAGPAGDFGPATSAQLSDPYSIALDGLGDIFIADTGNERIREVYAGTGIIVTVAGNGFGTDFPFLPGDQSGGFRGDGGPATSALLSEPTGIALDSAGNLYISEEYNNRVREVAAATGIINTIAGNGATNPSTGCGTYNGDNIPALTATLSCPFGIAVDAANNVYIADYDNLRIRKIDPVTGIISTVAGNGTIIGNNWGGFSGDTGPATLADLANPTGITLDSLGNMYIWDYANERIRKVDVSDPPALAFASTAVGATSAAQDVSINNIGNAPLDVASIAVSANFGLGGADTSCALSQQVVAPTASCTLGIDFTPTTPGPLTGAVTLIDNALNAGAATQKITLSGTATGALPRTTPTVTLAPSPSSITTAQGLTVTVTVNGGSSNPTPAGTVTLTSGGTAFAAATLNSGAAAIVIPIGALPLGNDTLSATYTPGPASAATYNDASGSSSVNVTAPPRTTPAVTLTPSAAAISSTQPLTVTIAVAGTPTPTGTITLVAGSFVSTSTPLQNGAVTLIIPANTLSGGTARLTATYAPDSSSSSTYNSATGSSSVTVTAPAKTTPAVTVAPSPASITATQALAVTITVAGSPTPTGSVTLSSGSYASAATPLVAGVAIVNVPAGSLAAGTDPLNAVYTPDSSSSPTYNAATGSSSVNVTAPAKTTPAVTVAPSPASITATQPLAVTITVAGSPTPTGSVTLSSGSYTSAATPLVAGVAIVNVPAGSLAPGTDPLNATYTPDSASSPTYNSATGSSSVTVTAAAVSITVGTSPAGLSFTVDGTGYTATQTLTWTVGSSHTIAVTSPQTSAGTQNTFASWSDGGAASHSVTAPATATAYTAAFTTSYQLTTAASPSADGTVSPPSGSFYAAGSTVNLTATPNSGYAFSSWTGSVAAPASAATTVTMSAPQTVTANFSAAAAPIASLTPIAFPSTTVGVTSSALAATLSNTGTAPLAITGIALTGANPADFALATGPNACAASLAAGSSCFIYVTFTPASATSFAATLSVADNAAGSPHTAALTGTGAAPLLPQAVLSPNPLTFPNTTVNTAATALPLTLSNPGNAPLAITAIAVTGANAASFSQSSNCGASLAAGLSCSITVTFTPAAAATLTAQISVTDNAAGSPHTATLTGTGIPAVVAGTFTLAAPAPTLSVPPGAAAQYTIAVNPLGGSYNNLVTLSATGLPAGATVSFLPPAVTPGSAGATTIMTIQTPGLLARQNTPDRRHAPLPLLALLAGTPLLGLARFARKLRRSGRWIACGLALLAILPALALSGCGGGYFGPAPHTYTVIVTGTSGSLEQSTTINLTVQ